MNLNEIIKALKDEGLELPMETFSLTETLIDQGFDSMMRAEVYITLGEFYNVDLLETDEQELMTFQSIVDYIEKQKKIN